jgi:deazaflavin-dependent oxidoreductase (nitroreductase family)
MPLPRAITRFNRAFLNRFLGPPARYLPSFGVVVHRGRSSGRIYRTPVNIFRQPDGYVIALTYGVGDWVRNVLAAGECTLVTRGRSYRMTRPRLVHDEQRRAVPRVLRFVGAVGNVSDFLYLSFETALRRRPGRRVPPWVPFFNPIVKLLLAAGVPLGPDVLLTVRGRRSGLPRSTPVAMAEIGGRRWLISPFGEVDWARNLRAAGHATLTSGLRKEEVTATELGRAETVEFLRDVLNPYLRTHPVASWIVRNVDGIGEDPVEAAEGRTIFEVRRASGQRA